MRKTKPAAFQGRNSRRPGGVRSPLQPSGAPGAGWAPPPRVRGWARTRKLPGWLRCMALKGTPGLVGGPAGAARVGRSGGDSARGGFRRRRLVHSGTSRVCPRQRGPRCPRRALSAGTHSGSSADANHRVNAPPAPADPGTANRNITEETEAASAAGRGARPTEGGLGRRTDGRTDGQVPVPFKMQAGSSPWRGPRRRVLRRPHAWATGTWCPRGWSRPGGPAGDRAGTSLPGDPQSEPRAAGPNGPSVSVWVPTVTGTGPGCALWAATPRPPEW